MATTIGTFTIKGNDLGNYANAAWVFVITDTWTPNISGGGGILNNSTISSMLDEFIANAVTPFYGAGAATYTLDGPSTWNSGTDTIVTMTFNLVYNGEDYSPLYVQFSTEDYNYALKFQYETPVTPTLCNSCQFIQLTQCGNENFFLDLGLTDGGYIAYYTDNTSGVVWEQGTYSSQAQGGLSMYQWSATEGMFNPYSFYTMTLTDNIGTPVSWTIDGIEYNCATLTFRTTVNVTD